MFPLWKRAGYPLWKTVSDAGSKGIDKARAVEIREALDMRIDAYVL